LLERAFLLAEWTGLEPATPGVTGRYSNQLNYHSKLHIYTLLRKVGVIRSDTAMHSDVWRPQGDSNPCTHRERVMS